MSNSLAAFIASFVAAFALTSVQASAADMSPQPYLGVSGVASSVNDVDYDNDKGALSTDGTAEFEIGYGALLRGGLGFGAVRAEIELGYRKIDFDNLKDQTATDGEVDAYTAMINGIWDIKTSSDITPYVSIGGGVIVADGDVSHNDANGRAVAQSVDGTAPAGQFGIGVGYKVSPKADIVGGYSLLAAPTGDTGKDETIIIHSIQLGLNYKF